MVKNLPPMQETQVRSLGQEDPLEKGLASHSSILAWRIPWIEEPGRPQSIRSKRVRHAHIHIHSLKPETGEFSFLMVHDFGKLN